MSVNKDQEAVVVMIIMKLDFQLQVQPVPINTNAMSSNPAHGKVYSIQLYMIHFSTTCDRTMVFSTSTPVSPNNKTDRNDRTEIMLKDKVENVNGVIRRRKCVKQLTMA